MNCVARDFSGEGAALQELRALGDRSRQSGER
jgi:hypothetical protein